MTAKKKADESVPVGSVEIVSYHDFPDFEQDVPEIEFGYHLPVETVPVSETPVETPAKKES